MTEEEYRIRKAHLTERFHEIAKMAPEPPKGGRGTLIEDPVAWQEELKLVSQIADVAEELQELEDAYRLGISLDELEHDDDSVTEDVAYEDMDPKAE